MDLVKSPKDILMLILFTDEENFVRNTTRNFHNNHGINSDKLWTPRKILKEPD